MTTHLFSEYYSGPLCGVVVVPTHYWPPTSPTHMEKIECLNTSDWATTNSASSPCSPPTRSDSAGASGGGTSPAVKVRDAESVAGEINGGMSDYRAARLIDKHVREVLAAFVDHCRAKFPVTLGGESLGHAEVEFVKLANLEGNT